MRDLSDPTVAGLRGRLAKWSDLWGVPGLADRLEITFSRRFRRSLGRCAPVAGEVRLAAFLREGPAELLIEIFCHEAAHAAVYVLHGRGPKPHGSEWKHLMRAAGFEPRARIPAALLEGTAPAFQPGRTRSVWLHRCPVCGASRMARTRVSRWRCSNCCKDGLDGRLIVTRMNRPASTEGTS